jgi:putative two-component system response regulator
MAVADVYDALVSKRVYKEPVAHAQAVDVMRSGRAAHFDPDVLDCFLDSADDFHGIATTFSDAESKGENGNDDLLLE